MDKFHPQFPWGKGFWIWNLPKTEGGDIQKIIAKCKQYNISYLLIKSADGSNAWSQLTKAITDQFHAAGIKVYSWSFIYGRDPESGVNIVEREADLVLWSIEQLGVDGHILDVETQYEHLPNNVAEAEKMFQIIRAKQPTAFLGYAPFNVIDFHTALPYVTFGKYCDAVFPQMYWGTEGYSVPEVVNLTYEQWVKWQNSWTASGHGDSVKPIVPLGQTYDNAETNYVCTPSELTDFITRLSGYGSVCFWVWEFTYRLDLWGAIRDAVVKGKAEVDPTPSSNLNQAQVQPSTTQPEVPVQNQTEQPAAPASLQNLPENTTTSPVMNTPATTNKVVATAPVVAAGKTVITIKKNPQNPDGADIKITVHKPHIDYVIDFFTWVFSFFSRRGGDTK